MSDAGRQRILRESGHRPAQAEKESSSKEGKEALTRQEAERQVEQQEAPDEPSPLPESSPSRPRPRR